MTVAGSDGRTEMMVADDGRGFDLTQVLQTKKGQGLMNIQEQVRWLGGKVIMQSQPGKGAQLSISILLSRVAPCAVPAAPAVDRRYPKKEDL